MKEPTAKIANLLLFAVVSLVFTASGIAAPIEAPPRELTPPGGIASPNLPGAAPLSIEELFNTESTQTAVWSADGEAIIYNSDRSGHVNLWQLNIASGATRQLSASEDRQYHHVAAPDGASIIFQSDLGGREIHDLYAIRPGRGRIRNLTATEDVNETYPTLSADGRLLAFSSRSTNASSANVAIMNLTTGDIRLLTHEAVAGMQWLVVAVSNDDKTLIANRYDYGRTLGEAYSIDIETGRTSSLNPDGQYTQASALSRDGRYVALSKVDPGEGIAQAAIYDLQTKTTTYIAPSHWDQSTGPFSPDGKTLLIVSNVDGREVLISYDLDAGEATQLPVPPGVNSAGFYRLAMPLFSPDGTRILFPHSSGSVPQEYWMYDRATKETAQLSQFAGMNTDHLPETQIVRYRSSDGTVISGVLWMPFNLERNAKAPGIILAHGGPTGQTMDRYARKPAALASRGYVVLAPNFRGSTGYGRAFVEANRYDLGRGDLEDVVAGAEFLVATGFVDAEKIGITGGSYGGYMTVMALAKTPDLWAAGVDEFGIVNWFTMWENSPPQNRRYLKTLLGTPENNKSVYEASNAMPYLHQVKAPLLVLHGENDPRVPVVEAEQLVQSLKERDQVVDAQFYPDEGHGYAKRENQIDALERLLTWFDRHLKGVERLGEP